MHFLSKEQSATDWYISLNTDCFFPLTDVISIENTEYSGSEHFPDEIELNFRYYDNDERLVFKRDDETTKLLTGGIFRISNSLPEDIFEEKNKEVLFY